MVLDAAVRDACASPVLWLAKQLRKRHADGAREISVYIAIASKVLEHSPILFQDVTSEAELEVLTALDFDIIFCTPHALLQSSPFRDVKHLMGVLLQSIDSDTDINVDAASLAAACVCAVLPDQSSEACLHFGVRSPPRALLQRLSEFVPNFETSADLTCEEVLV